MHLVVCRRRACLVVDKHKAVLRVRQIVDNALQHQASLRQQEALLTAVLSRQRFI